MTDGLQISLEFGGGAELLFGNVKKHEVSLPRDDKDWTIRHLLPWMKDNLLKERPELFLQGDTVHPNDQGWTEVMRPGILVLVNDADWELLGQLDYKIEEKDTILFISTLHGG